MTPKIVHYMPRGHTMPLCGGKASQSVTALPNKVTCRRCEAQLNRDRRRRGMDASH